MNKKIIADRVRQIRKQMGLSQSEFAVRIGRTPSFIAQIEKEKTNLSDETVSAIIDAFHVNPMWLKEGYGDMFVKGYEAFPPEWEKLPDRFRAVRKRAGMSQLLFSESVGYSKAQIAAVEQGKIHPSKDMLKKVCDQFGINLQWLVSGVGEMTAEDHPEQDIQKIYDLVKDDRKAQSVIMQAVTAYRAAPDRTSWLVQLPSTGLEEMEQLPAGPMKDRDVP